MRYGRLQTGYVSKTKLPENHFALLVSMQIDKNFASLAQAAWHNAAAKL